MIVKTSIVHMRALQMKKMTKRKMMKMMTRRNLMTCKMTLGEVKG